MQSLALFSRAANRDFYTDVCLFVSRTVIIISIIDRERPHIGLTLDVSLYEANRFVALRFFFSHLIMSTRWVDLF